MTTSAPSPSTETGDLLGFTHGDVIKGQPCTMGDQGLILNERYVGDEGRRIEAVSVTDEADNFALVLSGDALYDEHVELVRQTIECRYCDGTPVEAPTVTSIEYE